MVLTQPKREKKELERVLCFHTTMVLTQLIYLTRSQRRDIFVSIPLWFLRNWDDNPWEKASMKFPYHYGSYATAFITKILYRFWGGRINQLERSRKQHRVCIAALRLDLILDEFSVFEERRRRYLLRKNDRRKYRRDTL